MAKRYNETTLGELLGLAASLLELHMRSPRRASSISTGVESSHRSMKGLHWYEFARFTAGTSMRAASSARMSLEEPLNSGRASILGSTILALFKQRISHSRPSDLRASLFPVNLQASRLAKNYKLSTLIIWLLRVCLFCFSQLIEWRTQRFLHLLRSVSASFSSSEINQVELRSKLSPIR